MWLQGTAMSRDCHVTCCVRLSGSWCFHCIGLALPSQLMVLIDYVVAKIRGVRGSADALLGYTYALSALLSTAQHNELGVPSNKAFEVFQLGQELVSTKLDGGNLAVASVEGGWALIGAYLTLGTYNVVSLCVIVCHCV